MLDGKTYEHKFGDSDTDVFLAFSLDGVSLFRGVGAQKSQASVSCMPLLCVVLSFDPKTRTREELILFLGVIPGPHAPKNLNSFIFPFYQECKRGAIGIPTFNSITHQLFNLRFYLLFIEADLVALMKCGCWRGPGAICGCPKCPVPGVHVAGSPTYYYPHQVSEEIGSLTDELLANLKNHDFYLQAYEEVDLAHTDRERSRIQQRKGINGVPILSLLPSVDLGRSFPFGLMHQLFENACPNMVRHWKGIFKDLPTDEDPYVIDKDIWRKIGIEGMQSSRTTPSQTVRLMPNIAESQSKFTAEAWGFWMTWLAPYLLEDRLPDEHYKHLLLLSKIIKSATRLEITEQQIDELEDDLKTWHAEYERQVDLFIDSQVTYII